MPALDDLYEQAMTLPPSQRAVLVEMLLDSLPAFDDRSPIALDPAWEDEIMRRIAQHEAGTAKTIDLETLVATRRGDVAKFEREQEARGGNNSIAPSEDGQ